MGRNLRSALGTTLRAGLVAATGATVAFGYGMVKAVSAAADFQQQLNVLKAVSGATAGQMRQISAEAIRLGKDVRLPATSAQDAALAMTELTKAGLSVKDAMAAARGTLQLAAAGETDAATAATVAATALNQFHLAGTEATHVADLLAGAANASAGDIGDFAEGLQYAGTASHAAGQSIELTVAALAEMANAGLQGSVAGSSLAQSLRSLQAPTAKAQDAMRRFNIDIYDAHGRMEPLDQIAQVFSSHLGELTQKTQNQTLAQIFGSRAVQAARIVFLGGADALDKYRDTVSAAGNAQRLAEARTKGFRGALAAFQSNIETLGITLGLVLLPAATDALRALSGLVDVVGKITSARTPRIALRIAWQGVGKLYDSLQDLLFGETSTASRLAGSHRDAGLVVPVNREGLFREIADAFRSAPWAQIGRSVATNFADALRFTTAQAGALVASITQGIAANHNQIADAGAQIFAEMVSNLLDPGFWKSNWKTALSIGIAAVPVGELLGGGAKIARLFFRPFARVAARIFPDTVFAVETLFRSGFSRIGARILSTLRGTATRFPTRFNQAFRVVERFAIAAFNAAARRIGGVLSRLFGRAEREGVQAFESVGRSIVRAAGKLLLFIAKVGVIRAVISGVVAIWNAVASAVQYVISKVEALGAAIASLPSPPSIPSFHIPFTAVGGITMGPQTRVVGERGREAILPLDSGGGRRALTYALQAAGAGHHRSGVTLNFPGANFYGAPTKHVAREWAKAIQPELARITARRG